MSNTIDGNALAKSIREQLKERAASFRAGGGRPPGLAVILVGEDPASEIYVRNKEKACREIGIASEVVRISSDVSESELLEIVHRLNNDANIDGVIVQLPLPGRIDARRVMLAISPDKDVDGLHPLNEGRLLSGKPFMIPCTPRAIIEMIDSTGVDLAGRHVVIVGRSNLVGKPLALLMLSRNATVTICHSKTRDLPSVCRTADVLISAAGHPGLITSECIKPNAVVIDVGTTRKDGRICGDVELNGEASSAAWISPVPGGVGPMTVTMLMANTLDACGA